MAATTVSEVYDAVLTTTARNMQPVLRDNITRSNKLVAWLVGNGRFRRVSGGERIKVPIMYEQNNAADIYSNYGELDTSPADGITSAFYPWSQMSVPITISGLEERQNNGPEQLMNLLSAKTTQSEASATELQNNCIVAGRITSGATGSLNQFSARIGKLDTSAEGPLPLAAIIDANPARNVAIGSINGSTETWWRNVATAFTAATFAGFKQQAHKLYNDCSRGMGGNPDLVIANQTVWELYFNALQNQERYFVTDERRIDMLGGISEEMLMLRGAVCIWDEVVSDVGTTTANVVDNVGTPEQAGAHGTMYMINSNALEYIVHTEADWTQGEFLRPVNQDSRHSHLLWQGQVVANNRRKLGVGYDIDNSIAA